MQSRRFSLLASLLAACLPGALLGQTRQELRVFLADNHAETAGWITRNFDLDAPHALVLADAHSDASAVERSEELREGLRRVVSENERAERVENWRKTGRLQAFNWIEPLMPRPLDQVLWLAAPSLTDAEISAKQEEAASSLDGRLEVEPRSAGEFRRRWETCDLAGFQNWEPGNRVVILAVDLDFFAGMTAVEREKNFHTIWERAMDWPGLAGVAFAVSRPWLTGDEEAEALVSLAVDAVRQTRGARLEMDASLDDRPDDSLKFGEIHQQGKPVARWDFAKMAAPLRAKISMLEKRLTVVDRRRVWPPSDPKRVEISPQSGEVDADGVWRFPLGSEPVLRLRAAESATGKVRWYAVEPVRAAYDLWPETGLGKSFSAAPARWIYEKHRPLGETEDFQLGPEKWRLPTGGRFIIGAEYETAEGWLPAGEVELRVRLAEGFRGVLSECSGMPYVFGIAGVNAADLSGVESGWGSDCANLLIHAWRRNGVAMSWSDPGRLRAQLTTKAENVRLADGVKISAAEIERGLAIDFGKHVAAVWEDREPLGVLGGNDLAMHHLGGWPELVTLGELATTRPVFSLRVPKLVATCRVAFAGDVVLAWEERDVVAGFERGVADGIVANLEGVASLREPEVKPRFDFRFPPERLAWLKERGIDAVSLANNHANDAGREGLLEGMRALDVAGIAHFGAGENAAEACRPWRVTWRGVRLAFFGISYFEAGAAGPDWAGVAVLPTHEDLLERAIQQARAAGDAVIAMVHGGSEYDARVTEDQRRWARWLVARGVRVIAGAHPHVVQREEMHGGAVILHSLGNAVYPKELKGADSGKVQTFEIGEAVSPR